MLLLVTVYGVLLWWRAATDDGDERDNRTAVVALIALVLLTLIGVSRA